MTALEHLRAAQEAVLKTDRIIGPHPDIREGLMRSYTNICAAIRIFQAAEPGEKGQNMSDENEQVDLPTYVGNVVEDVARKRILAEHKHPSDDHCVVKRVGDLEEGMGEHCDDQKVWQGDAKERLDKIDLVIKENAKRIGNAETLLTRIDTQVGDFDHAIVRRAGELHQRINGIDERLKKAEAENRIPLIAAKLGEQLIKRLKRLEGKADPDLLNNRLTVVEGKLARNHDWDGQLTAISDRLDALEHPPAANDPPAEPEQGKESRCDKGAHVWKPDGLKWGTQRIWAARKCYHCSASASQQFEMGCSLRVVHNWQNAFD